MNNPSKINNNKMDKRKKTEREDLILPSLECYKFKQ